VGNDPTNAIDPTGLEKVGGPETTDQIFQDELGLTPSLGQSLVVDKDLQGETYRAASRDGKQSVTFTFRKAYIGAWTNERTGRRVKGVYVAIDATASGFDFDELRVVQLVYPYEYKSGRYDPLKFETKEWNQLSGYDDEGAPSRGWRIDRVPGRSSPYFGFEDDDTPAYIDILPGTKKNPDLRMRDAPFAPATTRSKGVSIETCLIGIKGNEVTALGYLSWGFYIDKDGKVESEWPEGHMGASPHLGDALARWNDYGGKTEVSISNAYTNPRTPMPPLGGSGSVGGRRAGSSTSQGPRGPFCREPAEPPRQ
jgi:hypothetical protein